MADIRIEGVKKNSSGFSLRVLILMLFAIGFVTQMSVLSVLSAAALWKQTAISFAALAIFVLLSLPNRVTASALNRFLNSKAPYWFLAAVVGLAAVTALTGKAANGARRWLEIGGISVQSSELLKVAIILALAAFFDDPVSNNRTRRFFIVSAVAFVCFGVVVWQSDFSTAVTIYLLILFMMVFANFSIGQLAAFLLFGVGAAVVSILIAPYRCQRILNHYIEGEIYQTDIAKVAISNGGWFGCGWGAGIIKSSGNLPEAESDFIFAVLAEEFGFLGVLFIFFLIICICAKGLMLADRVKHQPSRFFLVLGIVFLFLSQTLINLAVVVGILPTTGLPLPLLSQGGSSLLCTMFLLGLLVHVAETAEDKNG